MSGSSFWFSTHDVVLIGWRLAKIAPLLQQGKLSAIHALDARYYGLSGDAPFVSEMIIKPV